jgi:hypothetical protein
MSTRSLGKSSARESGSYVADIFGDLPRDLMGLLIGDRVKARRIEKVAVLWKKTRGGSVRNFVRGAGLAIRF